MIELAAGLLIFLGVHSVRIVADGRRTRMIAALEPQPSAPARTKA